MTSNSGDGVSQLPDRLNILKPPHSGNQEGYQRLLELLLELKKIIEKKVPASTMRRWEARARVDLEPHEVDLLFARPDHDGFDTSVLPGERYENLRRILLRRKGLRA